MTIGFFCNKIIVFFLIQYKMPAVSRAITSRHFWGITDRRVSAFYEYICSLDQICIDILNDLHSFRGIKLLRLVVWRNAKSYNNTMYMGPTACFAIPTESTMSKINMNIKTIKQRLPHTSNLFTLRNRVGGHVRRTNFRRVSAGGGTLTGQL